MTRFKNLSRSNPSLLDLKKSFDLKVKMTQTVKLDEPGSFGLELGLIQSTKWNRCSNKNL